MEYFEVNFANYASFIMKTKGEHTVEYVVNMLSSACGMHGFGGAIYNPSQFISVVPITSPDKRHKQVARDLEKVLF